MSNCRRATLTLPGLDFFVHSYVVVGAVCAGGTWYLTRLARGPNGEVQGHLTFLRY